MQGNVDGDDVISVSDAVATLKIYAMSAAGMDVSSFTAAQFRAADIDGMASYRFLMQYIC